MRAVALAFAFVAPTAAMHGGYFPTSWGWGALGLLTVAGVALFARRGIRLQLLELAVLAAATGLLGWTLVSVLWSTSATQTMLEAERMLVYIAGLAAGLLVVRHGTYRAFIAGTWVAVTAVSGYALATRLFPGWYSTFDSFAGYRLSEPIGYWNALGIFAAMGALLALGLAARARALALRAAAGGSLPVMMMTLYFTFSRGAWLALAAGLGAAVAVDRRRLQLIATFLVVAPPSGLAIAAASQSDALTHENATLTQATQEGSRLALLLVALSVASAIATAALGAVAGRLTIARRVRLLCGGALVLTVAGLIAAIGVQYGGPTTLAKKAYGSLNAAPPRTSGDLNRRLFTLASPARIAQWRVAWQDWKEHPWLGSGAGTYEEHWLQQRPNGTNVRNAHNLYLETLAELGPVGLVLLAVLLALPLAAAIKARRRRLVAPVFGAYVAYLAHAAVDWDWELTAVTMTTLFCGVALLVAARGDVHTMPLPIRMRLLAAALTLVLGGVASIGLIGNLALASSGRAAAEGNWTKVEAATRTARKFAPWSSAPWQMLGEAQVRRGDLRGARASFRAAIAKDGRNWFLWFDLAGASRGPARMYALAQALRLNPLSPEIAGSYTAKRSSRRGGSRSSR